MRLTLVITTTSGKTYNDSIDASVHANQSSMQNMIDTFNDWYPDFKQLVTNESLNLVQFNSERTGKCLGSINMNK
jgi:hypothetical protein